MIIRSKNICDVSLLREIARQKLCFLKKMFLCNCAVVLCYWQGMLHSVVL